MDEKMVKVLNDLKVAVGAVELYSDLREVWDVSHSIFADRQRLIETKISLLFSVGDKVEWFSKKRGGGKWTGKITRISSKTATVDASDLFGKKCIWKVGFTMLKKIV